MDCKRTYSLCQPALLKKPQSDGKIAYMSETKKDTNIAERIKSLRADAGLTQEGLVCKMGDRVDRVSISNWERGVNIPSYENILELAKVLNSSYEYIKNGKKTLLGDRIPLDGRIPLLSWTQARDFTGMEDLILDEQTVYLTIQKEKEKNCFALTVENDAMQAQHGQSFMPGQIIVVDSNQEPKTGNYVLAKIPNSEEAIFKRYVKDAGKVWLMSLNERYPAIEFTEEMKIIGTVIEMRAKLI